MKSRLRPSLEIGSGLRRLKEAASEFTSGQVPDSQRVAFAPETRRRHGFLEACEEAFVY